MMRSLDHPSQFARAPVAATVGLVVSIIGNGAVPGSAETDGAPREAIDPGVALASAGQEASGLVERRRIAELEAALASATAQRAGLQRGISALRKEIYDLLLANERRPAGEAEQVESESRAEERLSEAEAERSRLEQTVLELQGEVDQLRDINEWLALVAAERFLAEPEPELELAVSAELTESVEFAQSAKVRVELGPAPLAATSVLAREATATVEAWARAWSEQRVEDYLSFYSSTFEPAAELGLGEWQSQRERRVSEPARIEVLVAMADLRTLDKDHVEVVFVQSYESDLMADLVVKTLLLVREDGNLKIDAERASSPWES